MIRYEMTQHDETTFKHKQQLHMKQHLNMKHQITPTKFNTKNI